MIWASVRALPILGLTASTLGVTIDVGPSDSIQDAIDGASNGDEIVVAPGTYNELIDFGGKAVTLRSSGGPAVTVIDASGLGGSVVTTINGEGPDTVLDGLTITGGTGTPHGLTLAGGGMFNSWTDPTVQNCIFTGNSADEGGAMFNWGGDPLIQDCAFAGNFTTDLDDGGGAISNQSADPTIVNCMFTDNFAAVFGGAILNKSATVQLINCSFSGNTADFGGGAMYSTGASLVTMINCTLAQNTADYGGGIWTAGGADVTGYNSIIWDNSPTQIKDSSPAVTTLHDCNIMGGWSGPGTNNMSEPPVFVDPANGDYRLAPDSPCINPGDDSALPPNVNTDLDGNPRYVGPAVDLGPFESQEAGGGSCPWDFNGDGLIGITDFLFLIGNWGTPAADTDGDGDTGITDFLALIGNWGACP